MAEIDYKALLTEIIAKQVAILGPDIAIMKARNVAGLQVSDTGTVERITGDGHALVQSLIDSYINLSGQIVATALRSVFEKYPEFKHQP